MVHPLGIRSLPIPEDVTALHIFESDSNIKGHSSYVSAKAADAAAALELVADLALPHIHRWRGSFPKDCIFVAPHAKEASGDNATPQVFAELCALVCGSTSDIDIVQTTKVHHTGADAMERLISRPAFEGNVNTRACYVLIDDVTS